MTPKINPLTPAINPVGTIAAETLAGPGSPLTPMKAGKKKAGTKAAAWRAEPITEDQKRSIYGYRRMLQGLPYKGETPEAFKADPYILSLDGKSKDDGSALIKGLIAEKERRSASWSDACLAKAALMSLDGRFKGTIIYFPAGPNGEDRQKIEF